MRAAPVLVVAICSSAIEDMGALDERLASIRRQLRVSPSHVFHYVRSSPHTRALFFSELRHTSIVVTCAYVDRTTWTSAYLHATSGPERIRNAIVDLVDCLPDHLVGAQKLIVDQHRGEKGFIRDLTRDLRRSQRLIGRESFAKVVARPDHGTDAGLIQIADMFAGEVRRRNGDWSWGRAGQLRIER